MKSAYNIFIALIFFIGLHWPVCRLMAQEPTMTLNEKQLVALVSRYHPVARQADLHVEKSKAGITMARGGFDPVLQNHWGAKTFDGTEYYKDVNATLEIPTWYGIELYTGIEDLSGNRLDPSDTRGATSFAGISVPLAKDLLMDKRRAYL